MSKTKESFKRIPSSMLCEMHDVSGTEFQFEYDVHMDDAPNTFHELDFQAGKKVVVARKFRFSLYGYDKNGKQVLQPVYVCGWDPSSGSLLAMTNAIAPTKYEDIVELNFSLYKKNGEELANIVYDVEFTSIKSPCYTKTPLHDIKPNTPHFCKDFVKFTITNIKCSTICS